MIYVGSKKKIMPHIGPIIARNCGGVIVEPFCGGLNATEWFVKQGLKVEASDNNRYLIELYKAIADGLIPQFVNFDMYKRVRKNVSEYHDWLVAWAGICCSYSAKWFGGYEDFIVTNVNTLRNKQLEARRALLRNLDLIRTVQPFTANYLDVLPTGKTVYLDPPYRGVSRLYKQSGFNHDEFYDYCFQLKERDNCVFISEYEMPSEFTEVWSLQLNCHLARKEKTQSKVEKLFTI